MADVPLFSQGDVIIHTVCPQWGEGVVDEVVNIVHDGKAAQRLIVKFANRGRVTLNSAIAPLVSKDAAVAMNPFRNTPMSPAPAYARAGESNRNSNSSGNTGGPGGAGGAGADWLSKFEKREHELHKLPASLNDVFSSLEQRMEATLDTYKFSTEPRSLMDWAVIQTGLNDPMTKYTRHELEVGFERYARDRDLHLKDLVKQFKQEGKMSELDQLRRRLKLPAAVSALDRTKNSI